MDLSNLVQIVRESRSMTAMVFPLPDVGGCVDYAITEAGEYLDAILREKRTGDKRNNSKQSDVRKEWGQCGYMIASAMIQIDGCKMITPNMGGSIYTVLVALCSYRMSPSGAVEWLTDALIDWESICDVNAWDAAELMAETCNAFERKHLPELFEAAA
jgi:hypothetical protein